MTERQGIVGGCIVPHPPLLVPGISGRDLEKVSSTSQAMQSLGRQIGDLSPDVLVMISPHTPIYSDAFTVKTAPVMAGSFSSFGCPQVRISKHNDLEVVASIMKSARSSDIPLVAMEESSSRWTGSGEELDHGLLVPLYYLDQYFETPIVSLSISGLGYDRHYHLGRCVAQACSELGRRAVFVASGDLSHRLIRGAPAGYSPRGKEFDQRIEQIAASGDFASLQEIPESLVEEAGECGFRSIHTLWGTLDGEDFTNYVLSYEGPFGVGYLVSLHVMKN